MSLYVKLLTSNAYILLYSPSPMIKQTLRWLENQ